MFFSFQHFVEFKKEGRAPASMGATDSSTATGCGVQSGRFRKAAQVLVDGELIVEGLLRAPPAEAGNR
jgi:hypothetical protein